MKSTIQSLMAYCVACVSAILLLAQCAQENVLTQNDGMLSIDSIFPTQGFVGSELRIYGKGFSSISDENIVVINGVEVKVDLSSVGTLLVTIPQQVTTGRVSVKRNSQVAQGPVFTVIAPPNIVSLQPDEGFAGDEIVIVGNDLDQVQEVLFNGIVAVISSRTTTELHVIAPESSTGNILLTYTGGQITGPVFTYLEIPLIENVEVISGRQNYLHITGRHFNQNPSTLKVYLMGAEVRIIDQLLDPEPSHLLIAVPDPGGPNPVQIIVESNGRKSLPYEFTMTPTIFTFNFQRKSINGNNITYDFQIEGSYFGNRDANRSVEIRHTGTGEITLATIQSWDPNYITGQFTVDPATLGNYAFAVSVVVDGVRSGEVEFRP